MKTYSLKMVFVFFAIVISTIVGSAFSNLKFGNSIYFAAFFQLLVFIALKFFVIKGDQKNVNSQIRRIMIASMLRMFFVLIFLVITMLNRPEVNVPWTIAYGLYFLLYLMFDITKNHIILRPHLKAPDENGNN